jgi:hypothetical protein
MSLFRKMIISGFILFNFLTMMRAHLPLETKFFKIIYRPIDTYLSFFSLYQDWMMFAPNPSRLDVKIIAEVFFDDGTKDIYDFEDPLRLNIVEKYISGERFRKYTAETLRKDSFSYMWPDAAKFALRKVRERNVNRIPVKVELNRMWDEIPLVSESFRKHRAVNTKFNQYKFYTHEVL